VCSTLALDNSGMRLLPACEAGNSDRIARRALRGGMWWTMAMLGRFLEIGIGTDNIVETYAALQSLGFTAVIPNEVRGDGYAVVSDGQAYFGLYDGDCDGIALTFVRPDLAQYVRALRRKDIDVDFANLGEQEFHELGFRDPDGQRVTLVEARTFSPLPAEACSPSICGTWLEFSVAVRSLDTARAFWAQLGFPAVADGNEPHPWCRVATNGMTLGLHETAAFEAGPCFWATQLDARVDFLRAKGFSVERHAPHLPKSRPSATITVGRAATLYVGADPAEAD
jgi:catechol 2,3-dioxygenase-like lactoylglutathione lyase family enzyme